jgi:hypothetical protein
MREAKTRLRSAGFGAAGYVRALSSLRDGLSASETMRYDSLVAVLSTERARLG